MIKALTFIALLLTSGPSDEMFDRLRDAPTPEEGESVAQDIWASWMESGSPTVDLLMERAVAAERLGDTGHARTLYDRVILIRPGYAEAWHRRASLFYAEDKLDEALRDLNETLALEERHFGAWFALATLLERLGAEEEARDAYGEALALYPQWQSARQAVARLDKAILGTAL